VHARFALHPIIPIILTHGGRREEHRDGFLRVPRIVGAIQAAIAIQALRRNDNHIPPIWFCNSAGIRMGDVMADEDEVFGG